MFPTGERARAILFVTRAGRDAWAQAFKARPEEHLLAAMSGLRPLVGTFSVPNLPVLRPIALYEGEGHRRDGAV